MKVYTIRHGQTVANMEQRYCGQSDVKLTELGRSQAAAIAPILADIPFDKVYSSDLSRAMDTQKLALPGYEAETTPLLREFDVGYLAGHTFAEMRALTTVGKPTSITGDYTPFGGENADMICARVRQVMDMLEEKPYENVAIFAHNGVLNSFLQNVLEIRCDRSRLRNANCGINVFEFDGQKWKLLAWNYMGKV